MESRGIAVITNIPTPYRKAQLEFWGKVVENDINVFYCAHRKEGRHWNVGASKGIKEIFLRGFGFRSLYFNPSIVHTVFKKYEVFIVGGYGYPTVMIAIMLLRIMRKKYVLAIDGVPPATIKQDKKGFMNHLRKFFIRGASAYLASGNTGKAFCAQYGVSEEIIFNQFLTVDIDSFISQQKEATKNREDVRQKLRIGKNEVVVMYCGRLEMEKGIHDLIEAVNRLRKNGDGIIAMIVGEGKYRAELEECAQKVTGSARFVGHVDPSEIHKWYYASDIFVLPTYRDHWGLVVNEAMACSLPVIVTDAAGCYPDLVVENENGYIVEAGDVDSLANAINSLKDVELRKRFGEASRRMIMQWTNRDGAEEFKKMIDYLHEV